MALEQLRQEPYASIICYPRSCKSELERRLKEMRRLGVSGLVLAGEKQVFGKPLLGKGCVGIVALARVNRKRVALKIRRTDADRAKMQREARLLARANKEGVGPRLLKASENLLLMRFIEGDLLPQWLDKDPDKARVRRVMRKVLIQCFRLDESGLDHGELSHAPKHIIVTRSDRPFIVDFETASQDRRPSNVTSVCQFLFLSGQVGVRVSGKLGPIDNEAILSALRCYKSNRSRGNFQKVLLACGLQTM